MATWHTVIDPLEPPGHHQSMPTVAVNGVQLYYEDTGQGEPLLLIMGLGSQMVFWDRDFIDGLVERGFRVVAYDNRDVGLSSRLDHLPVPNMRRLIGRALVRMPERPPYRLEDMARDAIGLLDALGIERAHVVGASMGGMIAQILAIEYAERVRTLTSLMSHPGDVLSSISKPRALRALMSRMPRDRAGAIDGYVAIRRSLSGGGFPFEEAEYRTKAGLAYDRGLSPRGFLRHVAAVAAAENRLPGLRRTRIPALVVHGASDPLVRPRGGRKTAQALANARLRMIPGMGHEMPRAVRAEVVRDIANLAISSRR